MIPGLQADPWTIARPLLLLIVLPLAVGMFVKSRAATLAARAAPMLGKIGTASLAAVLRPDHRAQFPRAARRPRQRRDPRRAALHRRPFHRSAGCSAAQARRSRGVLGLATAVRNFGAALVPAASSFSDPKVTIMIIVGAIVCLVVAFLAAGWVRRRPRSVPA